MHVSGAVGGITNNYAGESCMKKCILLIDYNMPALQIAICYVDISYLHVADLLLDLQHVYV